MPTQIEKLISALDAQITAPDARVAIVSDAGGPDESSLLGTRDGYLRLARDLIALVAMSDEGSLDYDKSGSWDDRVAHAFYTFPGFTEPSLVGAYVLPNHDTLIESIKTILGNRVVGWEYDPQFDPPVRRDTPDSDSPSV